MWLESIIASANCIHKEFYAHKVYNSKKITGKEWLISLKNALTFREPTNLNFI
jgi:hypothetical protein